MCVEVIVCNNSVVFETQCRGRLRLLTDFTFFYMSLPLSPSLPIMWGVSGYRTSRLKKQIKPADFEVCALVKSARSATVNAAK